ncbi:MAG TPA: ROK family protein [Longimicrobiales bacterium]|nr:ROK family protein [Longimicrobiales bacterium]
MTDEWYVGIDIGGTNLVVGMVPGEGGPPRGLRVRATDPDRGADAIVTDVVRMARESVREVLGPGGSDHVRGMGVGSPGAVNRTTGVVAQSPNLGWTDYPLRARVQELADWPVVVDNDANCAAYGEFWVGAGRDVRSMVGVIIGTGIGGGIILDGKLVHGASDAAGELGHTTVNFAGRRCACGNYGCVEAYASGPNIAARAREGLEAGTESLLVQLVDGDLSRITAATVYEAVVEGDAYATEVMTETARILGAGIASVINLLNPQAVVVMGGVTRAGRVLFDPLRAEIRRRTFKVAADACRILPAVLPETAGVVGAAGISRAALHGDPA